MRFSFRFRWLLFLLLGVLVGYIAGERGYSLTADSLHRLTEQVKSQADELATIRHQLAIRDTELTAEKTATQALKQEVTQLQTELFDLRKELAFYHKIMAPELNAGGVEIESFALQPLQHEGRYHFRLVLIQVAKNKRRIQAKGQINLQGHLEGEPATLALTELLDEAQSKLAFQFRYFQVKEGVFTLPDGFLPEKVTVTVDVAGNKWNKAEKLTLDYGWEQMVSLN